MHKKILIAIMLIATPIIVGAQQTTSFGNDGVYGCAGADKSSVGREIATGPFVPVSEDAVSHNTHILVYKECVLDNIANRLKESTVAFMTKATLKWANEGNNGSASYVTNLDEYKGQVRDKAMDEFITGKGTTNICEPLKRNTQEALQYTYLEATREPESAYTCNVPNEQMEAYTNYVQGNGPFSWQMYLTSIQPQNNPLSIYANSLNQMLSNIENKVDNELTELNWGSGFKSKKQCKQIPVGNGITEEYCQIVTPGTIVASAIKDTIQTPLNMLTAADEIDELMGSLMTNLHTEVLTGAGGLRNLTQSSGGTGSYLDQVARDAAGRTQTEYTDTGLSFLDKAIQIETAYKTVREGSQVALESTIQAFKTKEDGCWDAIITRAKADLQAETEDAACKSDFRPKNPTDVCPYVGTATVSYEGREAYQAGTANEYRAYITARTRNATAQAVLRISRDESRSIVASTVTPLLNGVRQSIESAKQALAQLLTLQVSLSGSNTPQNTKYVLEAVNTLSQQDILHTEGDVVNAGDNHQDLVAVMEQEYKRTTNAWDRGWCRTETWKDYIVKN